MKINKNAPVFVVAILFIFCAISALLLAWVNQITAPKIEALKSDKAQAAMRELIPQGKTFTPITLPEGTSEVVKSAYDVEETGTDGGTCVIVAPQGYAGAVDLMVYISREMAVINVKIVSTNKETAGIGTKTDDPQWLAQFKDKKAPLKLVKKAPEGEGEVQAITGATVTSTAVTDGVQAALSFVGGITK